MSLRTGAWATLAVAALCFVAFGFRLGSLGITDLDEGLYAAAARGMAITGDLVTPRVNGEPFYEKPPLLYWLSAASIHALGPTEAAARLPSALAASLLVFLTFRFGSRHFGRTAGMLAASFLALAPVFVAAGRLMTTDALLCCSVSLALFCAYEMRGVTPAKRTGPALLLAASCGAGLLAKGAPGLALPALVIALDAIWRRLSGTGASPATPLRIWILSLLLLSAIVIPWHLAAYRSGGQNFVSEYIVRQHIRRFKGGDTSHLAPFWFYIPGFVAGCFPWSPFALAALARSSGRRERDGAEGVGPSPGAAADLRRYLSIWFGVVFVIFSASGSKLISYILPLYPAAALLAGDWCSGRLRDRRFPAALLIGGICATAVTALVLGALLMPAPVVRLINAYADRPVRLESIDPTLLRPAILLVGIAALTSALFSALVALRHRTAAMASLPLGMTVFLCAALLAGVPVVQSRWIEPLHALVREAGAAADRNGRVLVAVAPPGRPSALYYATDSLLRDNRVELVDGAKVPDRIAVSAADTTTYVIGKRDADWPELAPGAKTLRVAGPYCLVQITR